MKTCPKCNQTKPETDYYKNKYKRDGLQTYCKNCSDAVHAAYSATADGKLSIHRTNTNANGHARQQRFDKSDKGKEKRERLKYSDAYKRSHLAANQRFRIRYPLKTKAVAAVQNEIVAGRMPPASFWLCRVCWEKSAVHYHHWSYAPENWIKVIPVCHDCHVRIHIEKIKGICPETQEKPTDP